MNDIYTMLPGVIVTWDGNMATVRPTVDKLLSDGSVLEAPKIVRVPVKFPVADGGRAYVTVPLKPGDPVELTFSCRSLENWINGADSVPDDPRQFDITDCFATPVMRPPKSADTTNLVVAYGSGSFKIAPSGELTFEAPSAVFMAPVTFEKNVAMKANTDLGAGGVTHQGKSIGIDHKHGGVQQGNDTSGGVA